MARSTCHHTIQCIRCGIDVRPSQDHRILRMQKVQINLAGTLSSYVHSQNPVSMHPSYLRPSCLILIGCRLVTLWVNSPLSKKAVLSALPYFTAGALQLFIGCTFIYTMYHTMQYLLVVIPFFYLGCMHKLITLHW